MNERDLHLFQELLEHSQDPVCQLCFYTLANKEEAVEVAQLACIQLYREMNRVPFNTAFNQLFRIATKLVLEKAEKKKESQLVANSRKDILTIEDQLMYLAPKQRLTLILKHLLHFSTEEISEIMEVSLSYVREMLHIHREEFRKICYPEEKMHV